MSSEKDDILLSVENLSIEFNTDAGVVRAVDNVSFDMPKGKTLGIVGESGCGKSVTALSMMRLIPTPPGRVANGRILYKGTDLLTLPEKDMRRLRGNRISMIFQEPMTSLNPVFTVGYQIAETVRLHQGLSRKAALAHAVEMLQLVGIPSPTERANAYPHELSGGMRQRVMIAMALACKPDLLIADEPTTALDVTIQAQILELIQKLQAEMGMSVILITHDLAVVAETCDVVTVMYAGRVVETADVVTLFQTPKHPYTYGLLQSIPTLADASAPAGHKPRLRTIPGMVPNLLQLKPGCRFQDRCFRMQPKCQIEEPDLFPMGKDHVARCFFPVPS